jgi:hypothetical protein
LVFFPFRFFSDGGGGVIKALLIASSGVSGYSEIGLLLRGLYLSELIAYSPPG